MNDCAATSPRAGPPPTAPPRAYPPSSTFIVKVAGACNLNCTYCYMYNMGDGTARLRPRVMSDDVAAAALQAIFAYGREHRLPAIALALHGGEPLLVGKGWMRAFLHRARSTVPAGVHLEIGVQTNGTLLDSEWLALFTEFGVHVGISMDGPPAIHDRNRVNFAGDGSYRQARRAVELLAAAGTGIPSWGVLTVANPEYSGSEVAEHLLELGVTWMDFLWPEYHHDNPPPWPEGSLRRYYCNLFDFWFDRRDPAIRIRWFESVIRMLLGAEPELDAVGPRPLTEVVVETDGSLEPLDVLRICGDGMTRVGLNVLRNRIDELRATRLFELCLSNQALLPESCRSCSAYAVCGGGYMPHRWGNGREFSNASVHCADLLAVFGHIRRRVNDALTDAGAAPAHAGIALGVAE